MAELAEVGGQASTKDLRLVGTVGSLDALARA
jgi:hypothetical protein